MRIGIAQINPCVGDLEGNVALCERAVAEATLGGAEVVVLPEMVVPGYPPRDILYDESFIGAVAEANADLAARCAGSPPVVVGTLERSGKRPPGHPGLHNVAAVLEHGLISGRAVKRLLPSYDVFHEPRWFLPADGPSPPLELAGRRLGLMVCEDLWDEGYEAHPPVDMVNAGAEILVALHATPYRRGAMAARRHHAHRPPCPVVYVNLWGGQDELIFDGRSFVTDGRGGLIAELAAFEEEIRVVDLDLDPSFEPDDPEPSDGEAELFAALVLGVRDFARKNGLDRAVIGLSGGIDSAVVAVIAAAALGAENTTTIAIPSRFTDPRSTECARQLSAALGAAFEVVPMEGMHRAAEEALERVLDGGTTDENIQARLRAMVLMSWVNRHGGLLVNTSNKTEMALGYTTLYGDMAGGLCPIADLGKPEVMALARWIDAHECTIPPFTLERPPSAELRAGQVDPFDYQVVAPVVDELVMSNRSDSAMRRSEHKRWQAGVVLKVSEKAFGSGRLIPVTRK